MTDFGKDILDAPNNAKPRNSIEITEGLPKLLNLLRNGAGATPEGSSLRSELLQDVSKFVRVKCDNVFASGTEDIVVTLEPTERLIEYVSALGAGAV